MKLVDMLSGRVGRSKSRVLLLLPFLLVLNLHAVFALSPPFHVAEYRQVEERNEPTCKFTAAGLALAEPQLGGGSISLVFDSSFPPSNVTYARILFGQVYPRMVSLYGSPSNTIGVTVTYRPDLFPTNFYYSTGSLGPNSSPTIIMSFVPVLGRGQTNDKSWDHIFAHELAHAFHDGVDIFSSWIEEGMAETITDLVARQLVSEAVRDIFPLGHVILKRYDSWNRLGGDVLAGVTSVGQKIPALINTFEFAASGLFMILTTELSVNSTNPYDLLARINRDLYAVASASRDTSFTDARFIQSVTRVAGQSRVEGQAPSSWIGEQAITKRQGAFGPQLGAYFADPEVPSRITIFAFDRVPTVRNPFGSVENPILGLRVTIRLIDSSGRVVRSLEATTSAQGTATIEQLVSLPEGGYRLETSASTGGIQLSSVNFGLSSSMGQVAADGDSKLFGVTVNLSGRPVAAAVAAQSGSVVFRQKGAFVVETSTTTIPFSVTLLTTVETKRIGKPNPYTRVVTLAAQEEVVTTTTAVTTSSTTSTTSTLTTSTSLTSLTSTQLIPQASDFSLQITPQEQRLNQGGNVEFTVTVISVNGFASPVTFTLSGIPSNVSASFNPQTVIPPGSSKLTILTKTTIPEGKFQLSITGSSSEKVRTTNVFLTLISASPRAASNAIVAILVTIPVAVGVLITVVVATFAAGDRYQPPRRPYFSISHKVRSLALTLTTPLRSDI